MRCRLFPPKKEKQQRESVNRITSKRIGSRDKSLKDWRTRQRDQEVYSRQGSEAIQLSVEAYSNKSYRSHPLISNHFSLVVLFRPLYSDKNRISDWPDLQDPSSFFLSSNRANVRQFVFLATTTMFSLNHLANVDRMEKKNQKAIWYTRNRLESK